MIDNDTVTSNNWAWNRHSVNIYVGLILFGLFAFVFYHFVVFPLFLDYALYGVLGIVLLLAALLWLLPSDERLRWSVLFVGFLLVVRGLYRVEFKPLWEQIVVFLLLSIVCVIASKIVASRIRVLHVVTLCLVAGLLFSQFTKDEIFFAKHFQVLYESPQLYDDTNVDYFPLQLADLTGDGKQEVITQGYVDHDYVHAGKEPMDLEASQYMVFQYLSGDEALDVLETRSGFTEIGTSTAIEPLLWDYVNRDYIGFPYYTTEWAQGDEVIHKYKDVRQQLIRQGMLQLDFFNRIEDELAVDIVDRLGTTSSLLGLLRQDTISSVGKIVDTVDKLGTTSNDVNTDTLSGVYDVMIPLVDRVHLIHRMLPFGNTAFAALAMSGENVMRQSESWQTVSEAMTDRLGIQLPAGSEGALLYGTAYVTEQAKEHQRPELLLYHNGLEVYQQPLGAEDWVLIARLTSDMLRQVADGEFLFADITGDGIDEILLSGTPSQVLRLLPAVGGDLPYAWEQLWVARDDVFRFESVTDSNEIVALSQSYFRNENRRFLTGYTFVESGDRSYEMKPLWRVNQSVINVRVGDLTGDGSDELVASFYRDHRFVVLRPHGLPVQEAAWVLTLFVFGLAGFGRWKYGSRIGGVGVSVFVLVVVLVGCSHTSSIGPARVIEEPATESAATDGTASNGTASEDTASAGFTAAEWQEYWQEAVAYTDEYGQRFWYSGWVATKVQKRRSTSMYDGVVVRDQFDKDDQQGGGSHQIMVNARLLGTPYQYYESGDSAYINEDGQWKRLAYDAGYPVNWLDRYGDGISDIDGVGIGDDGIGDDGIGGHSDGLGVRMSLAEPFAAMGVFATFDNGLYPFVKEPQIVGTDRILGAWCDKVVFTVNDPANRDATMQWSVWVGQEEPYIYQYEVDTLMSVPGAGMMQQTTFFRFWNYNDVTIQVTEPVAIEKQIVEREQRQIADILHALEDESARELLSDTEIRLLELRLEILQRNVADSFFAGN